MDTPTSPNTLESGNNNEVVLQKAENSSSFSWKKNLILWGIVFGVILFVCWTLVIYDEILLSRKDFHVLYLHGIIPRTTRGLVGIIAAPFLHISYTHVESDSVGILILGTLLMFSSFKTFFGVTFFVWLIGGLMTWAVSRGGYSIVGTGLWCFGWFGYLIITPFFERPISVKAIGLAVAAGLLYGGLIFGIFPGNPFVAWEANLCSLLSGVFCSVGYWYFFRKYLAKYVEKHWPSLSAKLPTSPKIPSFSRFKGEAFPRSTGEKDAAILPSAPHPLSSSQLQKNRLLDEQNSSPFGGQDIFQESQPATGVLNHSSEPEWLYGPNRTSTSVPPPSSSTSFQPAWLSSPQVEMTPFPPPPPHTSAPPLPPVSTFPPPPSYNPVPLPTLPPPPQPKTATQNVTFNPFD